MSNELRDELLRIAAEDWDEKPSGEALLCGQDAVADFLHQPEVEELLAALQPSSSARDVALKCVEICAGRKAGRDPSNPRWLEANTCENLLRAFADTLGNESAAAHPPVTPHRSMPGPSVREVVSEQRGFVEKPEVAWLIEFGGSGPRRAWWGRDRGYVGRWTENPNVAVRFARRKDAERACELLEISPPPIITEHVWFSRDHTYADTLGNESVAQERPVAGREMLSGQDDNRRDLLSQAPAAADPAVAGPMFIAGCPSPEEEAEHIRIAKESSSLLQSAGKESVAAQVPAQPDSGAPSEVPHPQPAPAAGPAPEARELTRERIGTWKTILGERFKPTAEQRNETDILCDMALRSLDLQQALARAQEERDAARLEAFERARGEEEATQRAERAEAELAKVREELDKRPRTEFVAVGWWDGRQSLFESGMTPERGALLFRPLSGGAILAAAQAAQPDEQSGEGE